tara:strand:- start:332 stop:460 length:129 start_codon:yes stop_codon:yes gene_type:complete
MDWNKLWKKHFPHLSPKEAHIELMQMFPDAEEAWEKEMVKSE